MECFILLEYCWSKSNLPRICVQYHCRKKEKSKDWACWRFDYQNNDGHLKCSSRDAHVRPSNNPLRLESSQHYGWRRWKLQVDRFWKLHKDKLRWSNSIGHTRNWVRYLLKHPSTVLISWTIRLEEWVSCWKCCWYFCSWYHFVQHDVLQTSI